MQVQSVFDIISHDDDSAVQSRRRAVIAAQVRVRERLSAFIDAGSTAKERADRIDFVDDSIKKIVAAVCGEYGCTDEKTVFLAATVALGAKHDKDCDCGFCSSMDENKSGFGNVTDEEPVDSDKGDEDEDYNDHAEAEAEDKDGKPWTTAKTACACGCDGTCEGECTCGNARCACNQNIEKTADTQRRADSGLPYADGRDTYMQGTNDAFMAGPGALIKGLWNVIQQGAVDPAKWLLQHGVADPVTWAAQNGIDLAQWAAGGIPFVSSVTASEVETGDSYQGERMKMPSADETGLGSEGSPKIDTERVPAGGLDAVDVDSKRNELTHQSVEDTANYDSKDFDPESPVRTRVDADKAMQPEYTKGPKTQTWTGTEGQADAVTSKYRIVG